MRSAISPRPLLAALAASVSLAHPPAHAASPETASVETKHFRALSFAGSASVEDRFEVTLGPSDQLRRVAGPEVGAAGERRRRAMWQQAREVAAIRTRARIGEAQRAVVRIQPARFGVAGGPVDATVTTSGRVDCLDGTRDGCVWFRMGFSTRRVDAAMMREVLSRMPAGARLRQGQGDLYVSAQVRLLDQRVLLYEIDRDLRALVEVGATVQHVRLESQDLLRVSYSGDTALANIFGPQRSDPEPAEVEPAAQKSPLEKIEPKVELIDEAELVDVVDAVEQPADPNEDGRASAEGSARPQDALADDVPPEREEEVDPEIDVNPFDFQTD